jgi:hypothetical protein
MKVFAYLNSQLRVNIQWSLLNFLQGSWNPGITPNLSALGILGVGFTPTTQVREDGNPQTQECLTVLSPDFQLVLN